MDANRIDVARTLRAWLDAGRPAVLATVVSSSGSAPRGLGAQLAVAGPQEWVGALSGGCTETAVIEEAGRLLRDGDECSAAYVAYVKETLADIGPVCGATLGVSVERVDEALVAALERAVALGRDGATAVLATTWHWDGDEPAGEDDLDAGRVWRTRRTSVAVTAGSSAPEGGTPAHGRPVVLERDEHALHTVATIAPSTHLVLGGGGDVARELVLIGARLGWRTTIVDPRRAILEQTAQRCAPDAAIAAWPDAVWDDLGVDARTACVALAHESHHDEAFLERALTSDAAYVGAVGSRRVQAARREALEPRIGADAVARLHGPAGLDLGGHAAAEIALAICAEIVASGNDRAGTSLAAGTGPIRAR